MKFHQRFNLDVDLSEAQRRFVNRVKNKIFGLYFRVDDNMQKYRGLILMQIADKLGEEFQGFYNFNHYIQGDFNRCLQAIEAMYNYLGSDLFNNKEIDYQQVLSGFIINILSSSEVDLGINWQNGYFLPSGAKELDEALVNEPLQWLRSQKYVSVLEPFEKALHLYMKSLNEPNLLSDVITDLYESLEALAKIVTGRPNKDLSANREQFVKELKISDHYKSILKEYISMANQFRHAVDEGKSKPPLSRKEVESFLYLTGLFIRLASFQET